MHHVNSEHLSFVQNSAHELSSLVKKVAMISQILGNFSATVSGLKENSENIRAILKWSKSFQIKTNLLALNAAIEAARAGEAGRPWFCR